MNLNFQSQFLNKIKSKASTQLDDDKLDDKSIVTIRKNGVKNKEHLKDSIFLKIQKKEPLKKQVSKSNISKSNKVYNLNSINSSQKSSIDESKKLLLEHNSNFFDTSKESYSDNSKFSINSKVKFNTSNDKYESCSEQDSNKRRSHTHMNKSFMEDKLNNSFMLDKYEDEKSDEIKLNNDRFRNLTRREKICESDREDEGIEIGKEEMWIISPDNKYKKIFDIMIAFIILYSSIFIPYQIAFIEEESFFEKIITFLIG
jgi:hypothetical protein